MSDTLLSIEDLSVRFGTERGQVQAVDGVSLHVNEGETLAIVGESGSGKSVTALSILRLLGDAGQVDRGRIVFEEDKIWFRRHWTRFAGSEVIELP
jgi:ABC-type dipeptide/oligopeptide/nickel transport system ATPase component